MKKKAGLFNNAWNGVTDTVSKGLSTVTNGLNTINPVNVASNIGSNIAQKATEKALGSFSNMAGGFMDKAAPFLMLPIAYGLLNNNKIPQPAPQPSPQTNYIQPGYIPRQPIIPQGFKTAGVSTPALILGSLHKKVINQAINRLTNKKDETDNSETRNNLNNTSITGRDEKTRKLLEHPEVKEYVSNLINT